MSGTTLRGETQGAMCITVACWGLRSHNREMWNKNRILFLFKLYKDTGHEAKAIE